MPNSFIHWSRISYLRLDGKMPAKKRQEALERFSIPISKSQLKPSEPPTQETGRGKRKTTARTRRIIQVVSKLTADTVSTVRQT